MKPYIYAVYLEVSVQTAPYIYGETYGSANPTYIEFVRKKGTGYSLANEFCYTLFHTGSTCRSFAKNYLWEKDERDDTRLASACLLDDFFSLSLKN